jgi:hypothetical protein
MAEKTQENSHWGVMVFVAVFVASILLLLADNAASR